MSERVAVVGAGIAGTLLAWRLRAQATVDLYMGGGPGAGPDATGASGGLVRAFETEPDLCRLATRSVDELTGSEVLRRWAAYREAGSVYLLGGPPPAHAAGVAADLYDAPLLAAAYGFRNLPATAVGVVERRAGYLSPARLRGAVLSEIARTVRLCPQPVVAVAPPATVRPAGGAPVRYDAVVVAAGAWTPRLLAASGLPDARLRTKHIQYALCPARLPGLGAFVDDTSDLYGRPAGEGLFLFGVPSHRWDVDPDAVEPLAGVADASIAAARDRFGVSGVVVRAVAAADCYHTPPGLRLRPVVPAAGLFTFTGGSGGAAKTALASSRLAAESLMARLEVAARRS